MDKCSFAMTSIKYLGYVIDSVGIHVHTRKNYPHEEGYVRPTYNVQEAETIGQVARTVPRIYAALGDRQADHQSTVFEVPGKIAEKSVSVLIDPGSAHNYITPC